MAVDAGQLVRAADRLADHVGHWTPARWAQPGASGDRTRADVVHALAQRLADLEASVTGREIRPVPRLPNDLALPDQVRVMVLDLIAAPAGPDALATALDLIGRARAEL
jgi:hypothetical protein